MAFLGVAIPKALAKERDALTAAERAREDETRLESKNSVKESLRTSEVELVLGKQLAAKMLLSSTELSTRVARMRRKFAVQYGFVVPEIKVSDSLTSPPKSYQIKIHGAVVATQEVRIGEYLIINGDNKRPDTPGEETREPAFGMKAYSISEAFVTEAKHCGFNPIDNMSVLLTHLSEVIRNNLAQLLSYKDMRALFDRLGPEYKRLLDEISPLQISYSGLQAVLKLLLAERISIRNLHLILKLSPKSRPDAGGPTDRRTCAHPLWRNRFAATSPKAVRSRFSGSATAGTWCFTKASSATPRAMWWSSTSTRDWSRNLAKRPRSPSAATWMRASNPSSSRRLTRHPMCA